MRLLVVRHAIAEDISSTGRDQDRPLSPKGREKFRLICPHLTLGFKI